VEHLFKVILWEELITSANAAEASNTYAYLTPLQHLIHLDNLANGALVTFEVHQFRVHLMLHQLVRGDNWGGLAVAQDTTYRRCVKFNLYKSAAVLNILTGTTAI
jgi:hypothetical protein